jgi:MFS family permease
MGELLRRRDIRWYLAGQGASLLGSMSLWLAAGIWVKSVTGSYGAAGMAFFCLTLGTLAAPLTGLLADRFRRRRLLLVTNLAGAALLLPLVWVRPLGLVFVVLLGYGALHGLIASGQSALLAELLPVRLLPHANGALRTVQESLRLLSPLAGAGLYAWQGFGAVVVLDIAGFLAAAASLLLVRYDGAVPKRTGERFRAAVTAGLRHLWREPALRGFTIACALATSVLGFGESAGFAVVEQGLGRPTAFLGVVITVQGVGAVVAGPFAGTLVGRLGEVRLGAIGLALVATAQVLYAVPYLPAVFTGAVLAGAGFPWVVVAAMTLLQRRSPHHLQGRVFSGFDLAVTVPQTLSIAVGAAVIGLVGYRALLLVGAAVTAASVVTMLRLGRRDPGSPLPELPSAQQEQLPAQPTELPAQPAQLPA